MAVTIPILEVAQPQADPQWHFGSGLQKGPRNTSLYKPLTKSNGSEKDSLQGVTQLFDSNGSPNREKLFLFQEKRIVTNVSVGPQHTKTTFEIIKELGESSILEVEKSSLLNDAEQKNDGGIA